MDYFYTIISTEVDDTLNGTNGSDILMDFEGNTAINGLGGDDYLLGVNPTYYGAGNGEIDTLSGGSGADVFFIGDEYEAYYQGDDSKANILDFDSAEEDLIVAYGSADDYTWSEVEGGLVIEYLYDPVAFLDNVDSLSTSDFIFI